MCVLNWCYKHFRKPQDKICADHSADFDESLILCETMDSTADKCICKGLSEQRLPILTNETVNVCYYPCRPSSTTTEAKPVKSIVLSKTTTSSIQNSYQTETECECSTEETESSDEDYEIQFSEEDEDEENFSSEALPGGQQSRNSAVNAEESSESRRISDESREGSRPPSASNNLSKQSGSSTKDM